jgi:hypothetical protein
MHSVEKVTTLEMMVRPSAVSHSPPETSRDDRSQMPLIDKTDWILILTLDITSYLPTIYLLSVSVASYSIK